jgi:ferric-dicitrate binding protein FerR (iron transport regulator)
MYMERIVPGLTIAPPRRRGARLAAGSALIIAAALAALPYWIALSLWLAAALTVRGAARLVRLAGETILFAGDLALGGGRPAPALARAERRR